MTGVGREIGIGRSIAQTLQSDGWTVITTGWRAYDDKMPWGSDNTPLASIEVDLSDPSAPARLFAEVNENVGTVDALIMCHCESVNSSILDTTVESFDLHFAVNTRATWLLIKSFAEQLLADRPSSHRRIVAITSDHTHFNLPYGASKGAMDRIVLAAAVELAHLGVAANVINPGATETGWIGADLASTIEGQNLQPRIGTPQDCANLVRFLCSEDGKWINNQLLNSDGGKLP